VRLNLWWDSDDRLVFRQTARGELSPTSWLRLHAEAGHANYRETGPADVDIESVTGEAGALAYLPHSLELEGAGGGSWFEGARDAPHYHAALRYRGLDRTVLEGGAAGGPVETPLGVEEGIRQDAQSAAALVGITAGDQVSLSYRHAFYSDANNRDTVRWEYGHRFVEKPDFRLGYAGTYEDTRKDATEYYAPEQLHLHRATARLGFTPWEPFTLDGRLSLGYGWEDGRGRMVGDASGEASWRITDRLELTGWISYFRNPRYWSTTSGLNLVFRF
jgi:hypothetical protein